MIYLDNAATTLPKPPGVAQAVALALAEHGNPARGAHHAAMTALRTLLAARIAIADLFAVGNLARVVFTSGATMSLNIAIAGLEGRVVATAAEHNSVLRPLHRRGDYRIVPVDAAGRLDMNRVDDALRKGAQALIMTHASNVCGNIYDLETAGELCRRRGALLIVDAAQTAGLIPLDMQKIGIAALCCSGHKGLYGPQGTGCLCLGPDFQPPPLLVGGSGGDSFSFSQPHDLPEALEAGTANSHGVAGLLAGVEYLGTLTERQRTLSDQLARDFVDQARTIDGIILYGDYEAPARLPIVALNIAGVDAAVAADRLDERYDIAVRAGAHCAPMLHRAFGTETAGSIRFSFAHANTAEEVEIAVAALREIAAGRQ